MPFCAIMDRSTNTESSKVRVNIEKKKETAVGQKFINKVNDFPVVSPTAAVPAVHSRLSIYCRLYTTAVSCIDFFTPPPSISHFT